MKKYEGIIIMKPLENKKERAKIVDKFKNLLSTFSNEKVKVEDLGTRKLAYEIQKQKYGDYIVFNFKANPENIQEYERNLRMDDNVMKFLNVIQNELEEDYAEDDEEEV